LSLERLSVLADGRVAYRIKNPLGLVRRMPFTLPSLSSGTPAGQQINTPTGYEVSLALPLHDRKGLKDIVVLRV
jgi:hypothetical protein